MTGTTRAVSLESIREAAGRIYDLVARTPLVRLAVPPDWRTMWPDAPSALYLKLETFQPIGSFKIRGAYNAVRALGPQARARGVWTVSAGNAAQGVALAAKTVGARCAVLLTNTAAATKRAALEQLGADLVSATYDECWRAAERHHHDGMPGVLVHPFDDDDFISGNGTLGLELVDELPHFDSVVASVGGGGLIAGVAAAVKAIRPTARIVSAEPETAAPLAASFARGRPCRFDAWQPSFVDGAGGQSVLPSMWPLLQDRIDHSIVVSLGAARAAMRLVAERTHVIIEGAAAVAVAAALSGGAGRGTVIAIVSGGNIDLARFASLVDGAEPTQERDLSGRSSDNTGISDTYGYPTS